VLQQFAGKENCKHLNLVTNFIFVIIFMHLQNPGAAFGNNIKTLKPVPIGFSEALAITDSTSSDRYRRHFEAAIYYSIGREEKRLNECGYKFQVMPSFYESIDKTAPGKSAKELEDKGAWIIFGARRSDDTLLSLKSIKNTPYVTPMATGYLIDEQKPPFFSMYPSIQDVAQAAVQTVRKEHYGKKYAAVIDTTCPSCRDFVKSFENASKSTGLESVFSFDIAGDDPNLEELVSEIKNKKIDFLLVPNNSRVSGKIISTVANLNPNIKFVGTQGWGDKRYGFLFSSKIPKGTLGFCLRLGRTFQDDSNEYKVFSLNYEWNGELIYPNYTYLQTIFFIKKVVDNLCTYKPKNKESFFKILSKKNTDHFRTKDEISVHKIDSGSIEYAYDIPRISPK
jgi:hypothetical protein